MTAFYPDEADDDTSRLAVAWVSVSDQVDLRDELARATIRVTRPFNRWERHVLRQVREAQRG